jgi:hypothetical protein
MIADYHIIIQFVAAVILSIKILEIYSPEIPKDVRGLSVP